LKFLSIKLLPQFIRIEVFVFIKMAHTYILYSKKIDTYYIGSCLNLVDRFEEHKKKLFKNSFTTIEEFNQNLYVRCNGEDKNGSIEYKKLQHTRTMFTNDRKIKFLFPMRINYSLWCGRCFNTPIGIASTSNYTFRFFTDNELRTNSINWTGPWYDKTNLKSCNYVLSNHEVSEFHNVRKPYISDAVILENLDYVLLSSFGLGYTSYGSREGERHIIKKIPLNKYMEPHSHVYFDMSDSIPVHKISLSRLKFQVSDAFGNILDSHGNHISFVLLFIQKFD
jgi:predicted GIY-YIG superfamily endonuclease